MLIGAVSALVALLLYPPGFGFVSIICGVQLLRRRSEPLRIAMLGWIGVGVALGMSLSAGLWG